MKLFPRLASALVLMTALTGFTYASGNHSQVSYGLSVQTIADQTTVGSTEVKVTDALRSYFTAHGVDGTKIDAALGSLNQAYKDSIDDLFADSDRYAEIQSLAYAALKPALVRGSVEKASLQIGRHVLTATVDGPEDHDNE